MTRESPLSIDARELKLALSRFPTLRALHASPEREGVEARLTRVLSVVRRHKPAESPAESPAHAPAAPRDAKRVRAVHWNIEHGNWYEQVERALLEHPALAGADVCLFNEIDLGMARAANRDVTADLSRALGFHGVWAPQFLETTVGRDDDASTAAGRENEESLFGIAVLSRWPIGEARVLELPSPHELIFDTERMLGRFAALIVEVQRPGAPFVVVSAHLEVHRTREHRAVQMRAICETLRNERRPVIFAGDWNTHTFDRGLWHSSVTGAASLLTWPAHFLGKRLLHPDRGVFREPLFQVLREHGFEWKRYVDDAPTLKLRMERLDEVNRLPVPLRQAAAPILRWAERRGMLRLDWFAGRGWAGGRGETVAGLDGRGLASDHAPIVAEFES